MVITATAGCVAARVLNTWFMPLAEAELTHDSSSSVVAAWCSDGEVANRHAKVWHGATENGP
jgi:hypothetical protein